MESFSKAGHLMVLINVCVYQGYLVSVPPFLLSNYTNDLNPHYTYSYPNNRLTRQVLQNLKNKDKIFNSFYVMEFRFLFKNLFLKIVCYRAILARKCVQL